MSDILSQIVSYISAHRGWFGFLGGGSIVGTLWGIWEKIMATGEHIATIRRGWYEGSEVKVRVRKAKDDLRRSRKLPDVQPADPKNIVLPLPYAFRLLLLPFRDRARLASGEALEIKAQVKYQKHRGERSTEHGGVRVDALSQETCSSTGTDGSGLIIAIYGREPSAWMPYLISDLPPDSLTKNLFRSQSGASQVGALLLADGWWSITVTITVRGFRKNFYYDIRFSGDAEPRLESVSLLNRLKRKLVNRKDFT